MRNFIKENTQRANKHIKRHSILLATREMKIKVIMRYHHISITVAKIRNSDNTKCW